MKLTETAGLNQRENQRGNNAYGSQEPEQEPRTFTAPDHRYRCRGRRQ